MRPLIALAIALVSLAPSHAYDQVARFAAAIPIEQNDGPSFLYVAPPLGFIGVRTIDFTLPQDIAIGRTLISAKSIDPMTGIDFRRVYAVLSIGNGLNTTNVLFGQNGFAADTAATLAARGFDSRDIGSIAVLANGEDASLDLSQARNADPLAADMGRAQRVAVVEDMVLVNPSWAGIETALTALSPKAAKARPEWVAVFDALNALRGSGTTEAAIGWSGAVLSTLETTSQAILDGSIYQQATDSGRKFVFPPFPIAAMGIDRLHGDTHLRIALPYRDERDAEFALEHIGRYLIRFPQVPDVPRQQMISSGDWHVAVLTLTFKGDEGGTAHALLLSFTSAILRRQFAPLEFL
ncbi:hypothetical protein DEVEQU_01767 [Devosia equisanguinis]|uniref:Uncharacterized protein n=1 Tax=Devosia equisanguinis TaxID=2490941 RepID=A0A447IAY9_9HYPH|nr:hypothetical protein DEVEQU_01767 [Devosia equisanguinis]